MSARPAQNASPADRASEVPPDAGNAPRQKGSIPARRLLLAAIPVLLITGLMVLFLEQMGIDEMRRHIEEAGPLAPLFYILVKALTYVLAPLSSGPIQLFSGALFGVIPGTLYTVIGEVAGGTVSFLIARHLGRPAVRRLVGDEGIRRVDDFVEQLGSWRALIYARLLLFGFYDFISYAAGFAGPVTLRQYLLVSAIFGTLPSFLFVWAGDYFSQLDSRLLLTLWALVAAMSALPILIRRALQARRRRRAGG